MRQIDKYGRIWFDTEGSETKVGFTPEFIEKLQECFHIVPGKQRTAVRENGPLMAIETNTGLFSVTSPVKGYVTFFDNKALNFPEKITPDDTVCIISDKAAEKKAKTITEDTEWVNPFATAPVPPRGRVPNVGEPQLNFNANVPQLVHGTFI